MIVVDAVIVAAVLGAGPRRWILVLVPPLAAGIIGVAGARFGIPLACLAALALAMVGSRRDDRVVASALLLALPRYDGLGEATIAAVTWAVAATLLAHLSPRFDGPGLPGWMRGTPARLFTAAMLYAVALPWFVR